MEASDINSVLVSSSNVKDVEVDNTEVLNSTTNKEKNGASDICCNDEERSLTKSKTDSGGDNADQNILTPPCSISSDENLKPTKDADNNDSDVKDLSSSKINITHHITLQNKNTEKIDDLQELQVVDAPQDDEKVTSIDLRTESEIKQTNNTNVHNVEIMKKAPTNDSETNGVEKDAGTPVNEVPGKGDRKTKSKTKPTSKTKGKEKSGKFLIDDQVLSEVKNLMKAVESKFDEGKVGDIAQQPQEKLDQTCKVKEKKKKKSKRSNSKNCESSSSLDPPTEKSEEDTCLDKRVFLKRGTVWRNIKKDSCSLVSPDSSEEVRKCTENDVSESSEEANVRRMSRDSIDNTNFNKQNEKGDNEEIMSDATCILILDETELNDIVGDDRNSSSGHADFLNEQNKTEITPDENLFNEAVIPQLHVTVCTIEENDANHDILVGNSIPEISVMDNISVEEKFSFNAEISVVKPLHPSVEFLSDSSTSSLNTEKSSCEVLGHKQSEDSQSDFFVPLLFDDKLFSKLDGLKNLKFRNKKRHSLPKVTPLRQVLENASSYYSSSCHDIKSLYESAGEKLYDESCRCSDNEKVNQKEVWSGSNEARSNESPTDNDGKVVNSESSHDSTDDSDETGDTWHHKNIKEKIKKIIGVRLKHHYEPQNRTSDNNPLMLGSHLCSSSENALPLENGEASKGVKSKNQVKNTSKHDGRFTGRKEKRQEGSSNKVPHANLHMNLTFLTDSDQEQKSSPESENETHPEKDIVDRWGNVQTKALERQQQSAQFRQLQRQIKSIRLSIESILSRCSSLALAHTLENFSQISQKVEEIKGLLSETENLRSDLSSLNIIVHRFTSEMGPNFTPLKDEMAELYRLWDETHRRVNGELSHLQNVNVSCRLWEEQKTDLSKALKQDSDTLKVIDAAIDSGTCTESVSASVRDVAKLLNERRKLPSNGKSRIQGLMNEKFELGKIDNVKREDRLSDSGTSGYESCSSDDLSERERRLAYLRRLARDLQSSLMPGSNAWNEVHETLDQAEKELQELQDHCRTLITKTAGTLEPNSKATRFSSNCKRRNWVREGKSSRSSRIERRAKVGNRRGEWAWRVARAAVPFQVALMLLLCVACLLEPNCCDSVNTFNLSFSPQLRFVHGSPPV